MVEPADAKEMIDAAIERAEDERSASETAKRAQERLFRDRVALMVGIGAVALAIVHMAAAGAARESLLRGIEASDTFTYMQAKIVRETVAQAAAQSTALAPGDRATWVDEAKRLRTDDVAGHGIKQLQATGTAERRASQRAAAASEGYEVGETALQMAIVLLSIALVARSWAIVGGAVVLAGLGTAAAAATALGIGFL